MRKSHARHKETVDDDEIIHTSWTGTSYSQNDILQLWYNQIDSAIADVEEIYGAPWYEAPEEAVWSVTDLIFGDFGF